MALTENLASQNVGNDSLSNFSSGAVKGLDAGLAYAQAKQNSDQMSEQLSAMKDQHEAQKSSYVIDQINKAAQTDNKSLRKLYMDGADKSFQKFYGTPMSDDIKSFITNVPESRAGVQKLVEMFPAFASDPKQHALFVANFKSMFSSNLADAEKYASSITNDYTKLELAKSKSSLGERKLDQSEERLKQGQSRLEFNAAKNAQNSAPVQDSATQLLGAKKGLGIINQGIDNNKKNPGHTITWSQLHEVTGDLAGLTSAKISAVVPVAKQAGIESDIPRISEALGAIQREFDQAPSDNVPIGVLSRLQSQFKSIQKVVQIYHNEQQNSRLKAGVVTGAMRPSTAAALAPPPEQPEQQQAPTNDGAPVSKPNPTDAAKQFKNAKLDYASFVQRAPNLSKLVDEKTYNSL